MSTATIMQYCGWSPSSLKTVLRYLRKVKQELADQDADSAWNE
jgi:hypothetical protein